MLRCRQRSLAMPLLAGALVAAPIIAGETARTQPVDSPDLLMRPMLDGNPTDPPRFRRRRGAVPPDSSRFGEMQELRLSAGRGRRPDRLRFRPCAQAQGQAAAIVKAGRGRPAFPSEPLDGECGRIQGGRSRQARAERCDPRAIAAGLGIARRPGAHSKSPGRAAALSRLAGCHHRDHAPQPPSAAGGEAVRSARHPDRCLQFSSGLRIYPRLRHQRPAQLGAAGRQLMVQSLRIRVFDELELGSP